MTVDDDSPVSYRCPHCAARLTAKAESAGQRRECPRCGKIIKVPGSPGQAARRGPAPSPDQPPAPSSQRGLGNIALICPFCGTRLYASAAQAGGTLVCPDCLESVAVPASPVPPAETAKSSPAKRPPLTSPRDTGGKSPGAADDDDYRLSEPVELPRHRGVPKELADLLDRQPPTAGPPPASGDPAKNSPGRAQAPQPPGTFRLQCPVCDTMIYATPEDIGTTKECPDCFSRVMIRPPAPKRRRVNDVVEADYAHDEFTLGPPAELEIYHHADVDETARTMGEEALRKAEREDALRVREEPELPLAPLWTGVFRFLANVNVVARIVVNGILLGLAASLAISVANAFMSNDPGTQLFGIGGGMLLAILTAVTVPFTSVNLLTVLQDSADGRDQIENWPENNLADWVAESLSFVMAVFFAFAPGLMVILLANEIGTPPSRSWLWGGISLYAFLPITQLSILESASLVNPLSGAILRSFHHQFLLWCTFYLMTFVISLIVAIILASVQVDHPTLVFIIAAVLIAFATFLYMRLLGRLAWACQMPPLGHEAGDEKTESSESDAAGRS